MVKEIVDLLRKGFEVEVEGINDRGWFVFGLDKGSVYCSDGDGVILGNEEEVEEFVKWNLKDFECRIINSSNKSDIDVFGENEDIDVYDWDDLK